MNTQPIFQPCTVNSDYCTFGAQTLLKLLEGYDDLIKGVIANPDIAYVHKARVGSRRLRVGLLLFENCFSKKKSTLWRRDIKKVTQLLSKARDIDVHIRFVENYLTKPELAADKTGLNALLEDHKNRRKNIQITISQSLEKLKITQTLTNLQSHCENLITHQNPPDPAQVFQNACWYINLRLNDFFSLKQYIYLENESHHHHQMRIYAKKLRYTLECFALLYENKLCSEIQLVKDFQDILGELHDCDVWLDYLPKFSTKLQKTPRNITKNQSRPIIDPSLQSFEAYLLDKRKKCYSQLVDLWNQSLTTHTFEQLINKFSRQTLASLTEKVHPILLSNSGKIAVMANIHANLAALQQVFQDAKMRGAEVYINAGDSVGFGVCPNKVIALLCEKNVLNIAGNYDIEMLENQDDVKKKLSKPAKSPLSGSSEKYLSLLPQKLCLKAGDKQLFVMHDSPQTITKPLYADMPPKQMQKLTQITPDIVVIGHSHMPFQREVNGTVFVNPGSVGCPLDGNPQTAYALLSFNPLNVELIRLPYDVETAAHNMRKYGLPESFAQMLLRGVSINTVAKEDKAKRALLISDCNVAVAACEQFSERLSIDTKHHRHVTCLALTLFDELAELHKLGHQERCWLKCAAMLHDVGLSKPGGAHHKKSMTLILNDSQLPFSSKERRIIASIARYHRGGLPKPKHYNLNSLDSKSIHSIYVLAALLRLADSLDCRHKNCVKALSVKVSAKKVVVSCLTEMNLLMELSVFNKKKALFEKIFKRKVILL
ncbi:MAG: CHAD domain-containing protein [Nitrososphaerota archaeon]|jgi:putative phosphoesterase|nr:CHAD domain-containing protein [Nitrososphaerota archaeon]